MRAVAALLIAMTLALWIASAQAATREVITPPLGGRMICFVTNTRDEPVDVTIELVDSSSQVFSSVDHTLGPLQTDRSDPAGGIPCLCTCRVTSADTQRGDLRVTLCTWAVDGSCQAAITAE